MLARITASAAQRHAGNTPFTRARKWNGAMNSTSASPEPAKVQAPAAAAEGEAAGANGKRATNDAPPKEGTGAREAPRPNAEAFPLAKEVLQHLTRLATLAAACIALHQVLSSHGEEERRRSHERRVIESVGTKDDFFEILMSPHDSSVRQGVVAKLVGKGNGKDKGKGKEASDGATASHIASVPIKELPPARPKPKDGRDKISVDAFAKVLPEYDRVVFFLGDECSVDSGFPTRKMLVSAAEEPLPTWDKFLERFYPKPEARHKLYARLRKSSREPSQGYRDLAELMQATWPKMSLTLTTSFDDLLRQAHGSKGFHVVSCTRTKRSVGLARDVSASYKYNELVKLHGDYIDRTVNTVEELTDPVPADLRSALEYRLSQFPTALVFVGYDGEDENIAVMFNAMRLHGPMHVYWVSGQQYSNHTPLGRWFNTLPAVTWVDLTGKPDHTFDSLMSKIHKSAGIKPLTAAAKLSKANEDCDSLKAEKAPKSDIAAAETRLQIAKLQLDIETQANRWRDDFATKPYNSATQTLQGNGGVYPKYGKVNWSKFFDGATRVVIVADYLSRGWVSDNQAEFTKLIQNGATIDFIFPDYRDEDAMKVLVQRFPNNFKSPQEARERLELQFIPDLHRTLAHAILDTDKQFSIADATSPVHVRYFEGGIINYPFYYFEYETATDKDKGIKPHSEVLFSHFEHSRWKKIGSPLVHINLHDDDATDIRQHIEHDIQMLIASSRLASEERSTTVAFTASSGDHGANGATRGSDTDGRNHHVHCAHGTNCCDCPAGAMCVATHSDSVSVIVQGGQQRKIFPA